MKLMHLFVGLFCLVGASWAFADMTETPAPAQAYHQAGTPNADVPTQAPAAPVKAAAPEKPATPAATSSPDAQSATVLQAELTQLNQNNLLYQQKTDQQIEDLNNKNQALTEQVRQLTQALGLLNQEVAQLKTPAASAPSATNSVEVVTPTEKPQTALPNVSHTYKIMGGIAVLVILLLVWIFWPRKKKLPSSIQQKETDTEAEYDYMGSNESIPAKLNLARAYIAMEDYAAARQALEEVAKHGNPEQKQQAEDLRKEIPEK